MVRQCVACDSEKIVKSFENKYMSVFKCKSCSHLQGVHKEKFVNEDYHHQELDDPFIQSLKKTRKFQANIIIEEIKKMGSDISMLDFGCGRGWFVEECFNSGFKDLVGADYSKVAVQNLISKSIHAYQVTDEDFTSKFQNFTENLNRRVNMVSFLDVIEHFDSENIQEMIQNIISGKEIRHVIIKVPDSNGFFFIIASLLSKVGLDKPLNQLFQVFSFPPHYQYFNRKSFLKFSEKLNLEVIKEIPEKDFTLDESFTDRLQFSFFLPKKIILLIVKSLFYFVNLFGLLDSRIYFCIKKDK